jgi:diguanylate cyclase (GGDEF)-like protein
MAPDVPEWLTELRRVVVANSKVLLSRDEFQRGVSELLRQTICPLDAIGFRFVGCDNLEDREVSAGNLDALREQLDVVNRELPGEGHAKCKISMHVKSDAIWFAQHRLETLEDLTALAASFWQGLFRDDKSRLPSLQSSQAIELLQSTIRGALDNRGSVACLFCDLDKFKEVNDRISMTKGDDVIKQLASILCSATDPYGIPVHRSGDEFIIILPHGDQNDAFELGSEIVGQVTGHDFGTGEIEVGISCGIAMLSSEHRDLPYEDLEQLAEKTIKLRDGTKLRGRATLRSAVEKPTFPAHSGEAVNRAICIVKGDPGNRSPFESPFLNVLSRRTSRIVAERSFHWGEISADITELLDQLAPTIQPGILRTSESANEAWDGRPIVSPLDIGLTIANGLYAAGLRAGKEHVGKRKLTLRCDGPGEPVAQLVLEPENSVILKLPYQGERFTAVELGGFHYFDPAESAGPSSTQRALLIKIGHTPLGIPDSLFAAVLVVDDRPTRGGQLPDFWESVIARLIATLNSNPNIEEVYVLGNPGFAQETVNRLRALDQWAADSEYISYKTGANASDIAAAARRLMGKVEFVSSDNELYQKFADDLRDEVPLPPLRRVTTPVPEPRFLRRHLTLGDVALTGLDGCRTTTIAKAFPIVVEIARTAEESELIRDQAGQTLYELVDFKVHLTTPLQDRIPAFYRREAASLTEYLRRAFLNDDSLFGSIITANQQLKTILNHVAAAITNPFKQFATRRAILVLPHEVNPHAELSPLGLVSVRIIPRFSKHRTVLHYSFTWRTVEALVGFPYSIFGSVGFAEHLTELVREIVGATGSRSIDMGEVSYVAHSLHIFRDDYGQHIARRIVDDASL